MKNTLSVIRIFNPTYRLAKKLRLVDLVNPFLFLVVMMGWSSESLHGQVTADLPSSGSANTNVTSITVSHATGSGTNRLMLVGVSYRENQTMTVTYGGDPLDPVGSEASSNNARTAIFYMVDPPNGTANVVVTASGNFDKGGIVGVMTFSGVDINNTLNTYASSADNKNNPTLNGISSGTNELVFDVVAIQGRNLTGPEASQAQRWYINSGDEMRGGGSTKAGSSPTVTMSWVKEVTNNADWSMSAVSIRRTPVSDLGITKTVDINTPYAGQTIIFTLNASNSGPDPATNVEVADLLPSGYTYVTSSTITGTYNNASGIWAIGNLANSGTASLTITCLPKSTGSYSNTASISGDVTDNNAGNNSATRSVTICAAGGTAPLFKN